jgi:DNA polymerase III subunit epsilon
MAIGRRRELSAPDLARPWRDVEFCAIDLETTGLDLRRDAIIAFGLVIIRDGRIHCDSIREGRVHTNRPVSVGAFQVHGLRNLDLLDAPLLSDVLAELIERLSGRILLAHAAWIEQAFLNRALVLRNARLNRAVVDTAALTRAAGIGVTRTGHEPNIEHIAETLGLCVHSPHDALGDAFTTAEVFLALASRLERAAGPDGLTAADLVRISKEHPLSMRTPPASVDWAASVQPITSGTQAASTPIGSPDDAVGPV